MSSRVFLQTLANAIAVILFSAAAFASEITFEIKLESDRVSPGKQTILDLVFDKDVKIEPPALPAVDGLEFRYVKSYTTAGNFVVSYRALPLREGEFVIGPLKLRSEKNELVSNKVTLFVSKDVKVIRKEAAKDVPSGQAPEDLSGRIYVEAACDKYTIGVNEEAVVTVTIYSDWFDIRAITVSEPPGGELVTKRFTRKGTRTITKNGRKYAAISFVKEVYSPIPGKHEFGAADIKFDIFKRQKSASGFLLPLLNENEPFYENFIGKKASRTMTLTTKPFYITVVTSPAVKKTGTDVAEAAKKVSSPAKTNRQESRQEETDEGDIIGMKNAAGPDVTREAGYLGVSPVFWFLFPGPFFVVYLGARLEKRYWLATSKEPKARRKRAMMKAKEILSKLSVHRQTEEEALYDGVMKAFSAYVLERFDMETAVITESDVDVLTGERRISDEAGVKINVFLEKYNSVKYGGRSGPVEKARFKKVIEQSVDILASMDKKAGEEENSEKKNIV